MSEGGVYPGLYTGFVRDNADPERRFRVRVYCPEVMGPLDVPNNWLGWASAVVPWMGGLSLTGGEPPYTKKQNNGEEVALAIMFIGGNPDFPVWLGTMIVAPTTASENTQMAAGTNVAQTGGSLVDSLATGQGADELKTPTPDAGKEAKIVARKGKSIWLGVAGGGYFVLSSGGVDIGGPLIRQNGKLLSAAEPGEMSD